MTHSTKGVAHNLEQNGVKDSAGFSTSLARGRKTWTLAEQPMANRATTAHVRGVFMLEMLAENLSPEKGSENVVGQCFQPVHPNGWSAGDDRPTGERGFRATLSHGKECSVGIYAGVVLLLSGVRSPFPFCEFCQKET